MNGAKESTASHCSRPADARCHLLSFPHMRPLAFFALSLILLLPGFSQTASNAVPPLPKDPHELLAAAAPLYDFSSPELKPWHLTATYQFYDLKGKPAEQGTWEYWWACQRCTVASHPPRGHRVVVTLPRSGKAGSKITIFILQQHADDGVRFALNSIIDRG